MQRVSGPRHWFQNVPDTSVTLSRETGKVSMPWKECSVMDERLRFVARLLDCHSMTEVFRDFGISRKTGYKIFSRYKDHEVEALTDRSRRPVRYANQMPSQIESMVVSLSRRSRIGVPERFASSSYAAWMWISASRPRALSTRSCIARTGQRHQPRHRAQGTPLSTGIAPDDLWCADFKGEFKLGHGHYCYPLTVTDHASRYVLTREALDSVRDNMAIPPSSNCFSSVVCLRPSGPTTASPSPAPTRCSTSPSCPWWLRPGINIERIKPGHPQRNGRHELTPRFASFTILVG